MPDSNEDLQQQSPTEQAPPAPAPPPAPAATATQAVAVPLHTGAPQSYFRALEASDPLNRTVAFSKYIAGAQFLPAAYRNDERSIAFLVQRSNELGIPWTQGLQSLYMTPGGRVGTQGDIILSLLLSKGFKVSFPLNTREEASCRIVRPDGQEHIESFDLEHDAGIVISRKDGRVMLLRDKDVWKNYPKNMLKWRALANCARFIAADVIMGLYLRDELEDIPDENSTTAEPTEADAQRAAAMGATGDFTVGLKKQPAPVIELAPDAAPKTAAPAAPAPPAAQPVAAAAPAPAPVPTAPAAPQPQAAQSTAKPDDDIVYEIKVLLALAGGGVRPMDLGAEPPQHHLDAARLRAQALANSTGQDHLIVKWNRTTGTRNDMDKAKAPARPAPVAPGAPDKVEDQAKAAAKARLLEVAKRFADWPEKTALTRFSAFFAGFLGVPVKDLGKANSEDKDGAMSELETVTKRDPDEFRAGPEQLGTRRRQRLLEIRQYLASLNLDPAVSGYVFSAAQHYQWSSTSLKTWSEAVQIDTLAEKEAVPFLRLFLRTGKAGSLLKCCLDHNLLISGAVRMMEERTLHMKIEDADEGSIEESIAKMLEQVAQETLAEKAAESQANGQRPQPEAVPAAPEEEGSLFD